MEHQGPLFDSGHSLMLGSRIMMRHVKCILLLEWSTTSQRLLVYWITPGVVHNFPKAIGVLDSYPHCTKISQILILNEKGATAGILIACLNNRWQYTTSGMCSYAGHELTGKI